ncbi:MAG: DUF349 domain-containing protein [Bacteroidota bacterium]|nr:DUF349 domain-containing protein [Bacteroidota bacterium]
MVEAHASESSSLHLDPQTEAQIQETLQELLSLPARQLREELAQRQTSFAEVTLLAEYLSYQPYQVQFNRLMHAFENYVDKHLPTWKTQASNEEQKTLSALQKRFEDAVTRFRQLRENYEKQAQQAAERAQLLLAQLRDIVHKEQIDAYGRVRAIAREWSRLRNRLLKKDRKNLVEVFRSYLMQFDQLYQRYKDIIEEEQQSLLKRRRQIIEEIQALFPPENARVTTEFWQQQRDKLALLQREWQSIPLLRIREENELARQYRELVRKFRSQYMLFRSQVHQRIQKNPVLAHAYQRKKQIIELLTPIVQQEYTNIEQWRQAQKQVQNFVREWRKLTEATLAQDDSREVRRYYMPLNQQFGELLDTFYAKSEQFNQEYRRQQVRRLVEQGESLLSRTEKLLNKDVIEAWKYFRAHASRWVQRARRFKKEPPIAAMYDKLQAMRERLAEARKAYLKRLSENLERRIHILNQLDQMSEGSSPAPLETYIQKLLEYEQAGEVLPSAQERLNHRYRQAIQRYLQVTGLSEAEFNDAWLKAQVARQSPAEVQKTIRSLKAQLKRLETDLNGYQNTLALVAKGKGAEALRRDLETKIQTTQASIQRISETIKQLQALAAKSPNAPSSPSA